MHRASWLQTRLEQRRDGRRKAAANLPGEVGVEEVGDPVHPMLEQVIT
jgi:hypothetical protein